MANNVIYEGSGFNNTRDYAETMTINDIVYGKLSDLNDSDCYKITFSGSGKVKFRLNMPNNTDYKIRIFKGNSNTPVAEDLSATINQKNVDVTVEKGSTYYIIIAPNDSEAINTSAYYNLQVIPYTISSIQISGQNHVYSDNSTEVTVTCTPSYAYRENTFTYGNVVTMSGNTVYARTTGRTNITVRDSISGKQASLVMNSHIIKNYNQKYISNDACIISSGCLVCCVADISSFYKGNITLNQLKTDGVYTTNDASCIWSKIKYFNYDTVYKDSGTFFSRVKNHIDDGNPVLLHFTSNTSDFGHWVVAYRYTGNCTNYNQIMICDPAVTKENSVVTYSNTSTTKTKEFNNMITLQEAINRGSVVTLQEYYLVTEK